ncbi:MAG: universal stress protein [Planctomycetota bacterium]|nr:universal stress protein [Planctomycetota bacterium]
MYKKILVALENSKSDESLLAHIAPLAKLLGSELLLLHVADGHVARNFDQLKLAESEEMRADRAYLASVGDRLAGQGLTVGARLALGSPPDEIVKTAERDGCDLIAMSSHGHRWLGDLIFGSTIEPVRHKTTVPVLVVRSAASAKG